MLLPLFRVSACVRAAGLVMGSAIVLTCLSTEQAGAQIANQPSSSTPLSSAQLLQPRLSNRAGDLGRPLEMNCVQAGRLGIPIEFCGGVGEGRFGGTGLGGGRAPLRNSPSLILSPRGDGFEMRLNLPLR